MGWLPWSSASGDEPASEPAPPDESKGTGDPLVSCEFQDGSVFVYEDGIYIDRPSMSKFDGKWIEMTQVEGVTVERKLTIRYLQIQQDAFAHSTGGLVTTPVDENTVHLGRGKRDCAHRAKRAIRDRIDE